MGGKGQKIILSVLALLFAAGPVPAQEKSEQKDSLVRLIKAKSLELIEKNGVNYRKTIDATFFHNNTYFICDTALWNVDARVINADGNVKVVQEGTILTSDSMVYNIDDDLVQFKGTLVQLEDKDRNTLRTHNLDYNTRDSVALFRFGGAMKDREGQLIESIDGSYDAKLGLFTFRNNVNMYTDSVFIRTSSLDYESEPNRAIFNEAIDFWKDDNMLSADRGWYERLEETFFFNGHVHSTSPEQEAWCDSLYYYRTPNNLLMLRNVQVQDTTRNVSALANRVFYEDSLARVTLTDEAAVALRTEEKQMGPDSVSRTKIDTIYIGADRLIYYTVRKCDIPDSEIKAAEERLADIYSDPVHDYRQKAAQEAAAARQKAEEENAASNPLLAQKGARQGKGEDKASPKPQSGGEEEPPAEPTGPEEPSDPEGPSDSDGPEEPDGPEVPTDSLGLVPPSDSINVLPPTDSISLSPELDSLARARADSLAIADSLAKLPPPDTTRIGFAEGRGNVKIYRTDIQVACDSMRFCELDSIARFYINPIVWNDGNRQYSADSMGVLVKNQAIDRASLMSGAFIITQETETLYDQIRATEVMAYFDSTSALSRFDALGGANCIFYLREKEQIGTVYKIDTKMMSAYMKDGELRENYCFGENQNDAFPLPQLKEGDRKMKGFNWQPELQPKGREDITDLVVRKSQRKEYAARPKTKFRQTEIYFPGYMGEVYAAIEAAKNKPKARSVKADAPAPADSLPAADSISRADSLGTGAAADSLALKGAPRDSIDTGGLADSLRTSVPDSLKTTLPDSTVVAPHVPTKAELREKARQERIAAREARWAVADSIDAAKAAAKQQKKLKKQRRKAEVVAAKQQKQLEEDAKKLEKYVEKYRRKYEKQQAKLAAKAEKAAAKAARKAAKTRQEPTPPANEEFSDKPIYDTNGSNTGQIPEVHRSGYPERRELGEPTLDSKAVEPSEAPVQRAE